MRLIGWQFNVSDDIYHQYLSELTMFAEREGIIPSPIRQVNGIPGSNRCHDSAMSTRDENRAYPNAGPGMVVDCVVPLKTGLSQHGSRMSPTSDLPKHMADLRVVEHFIVEPSQASIPKDAPFQRPARQDSQPTTVELAFSRPMGTPMSAIQSDTNGYAAYSSAHTRTVSTVNSDMEVDSGYEITEQFVMPFDTKSSSNNRPWNPKSDTYYAHKYISDELRSPRCDGLGSGARHLRPRHADLFRPKISFPGPGPAHCSAQLQRDPGFYDLPCIPSSNA